MHAWLLSRPYFGPMIKDWEKNRVIRPKAKFYAVSVLWVVMGASMILTSIHWGLKVMLGCIGLLASLFILTRKSS